MPGEEAPSYSLLFWTDSVFLSVLVATTKTKITIQLSGGLSAKHSHAAVHSIRCLTVQSLSYMQM